MGFRGCCLLHGPWSRPKVLQNLWVDFEIVSGPLRFTTRNQFYFFCQSDRGVQALQKTYFELWYVVHWNGPIGFALGEAKEVLWWTNYMGSWQKNVVMINFEEFWMGKRRWRQEKARAWSHLDFIYLFLSKLHFWGICLQLQHIQCLVHDVVPLDPHLVYT